ncbi:MAG: hypothetical protein AB1696_18315 [Planctomycetota bacterium]
MLVTTVSTTLVTLLSLMALSLPLAAEPPERASLAFKAAEPGCYAFDTGLFRGTLKLDGKFMGLYPLTDAATGETLTRPPGVFSPYRVFSANKRYGNAARDWPVTTRLLAEGAVEVHWPAAPEHPVEMTCVYRWKAADTLDLALAVTPQCDMPRFEVFMSSYFTNRFFASVYVKPKEAAAQPAFAPVNRRPTSTGGFVMFPRDEEAVGMIRDGRWKLGSNPVDWAIESFMAAPLAFRRDGELGLTAVFMSPPGDCFAVASPWNPPKPDAGGYRSLYQCFFGRDLKSGETARVHCRFVINRNISDEDVVARYGDYLKGLRP